MRKEVLAFLALVLLSPNSSYGKDIAYKDTTQSFAESCRREDVYGGFCMGYIFGVANTLALAGLDGNSWGICGAEFTSASVKQVYENWVKDNPRHWREPFLVTVAWALQEQWSCRK